MSGDHSIGVRQGSSGIGIMDSSEATAVSTGVLASVTSGDPPVDTDGGAPQESLKGLRDVYAEHGRQWQAPTAHVHAVR